MKSSRGGNPKRPQARDSSRKHDESRTPLLWHDVDGNLHLGMDAAEHQVGTGLRKRDFHGLARLLRTGIEVEFRVEDAHIVGAGIIVEDPKPLTAPDRRMRRR